MSANNNDPSDSKVTNLDQQWTERQKKSAFLPPTLGEEPNTNTTCDKADKKSNPNVPSPQSLSSMILEEKGPISAEGSIPNDKVSKESELRADAVVFVPKDSGQPNLQQTTQNTDSNTKNTLNSIQSEGTRHSPSRIYSLSSYKCDRFVSQFKTESNATVKLEQAYGLCSIDADRLLIADFDDNKSILTDIDGCVYNCYKHTSTPKDFAYDPCHPSRVVVALQKEIIMLDLETKAIITKTNTKGFYPWKLQYLIQHKVYTASDPTNGTIHFLNENLEFVGGWMLNSIENVPSGQATNSNIKKYYPYATHFTNDMKVLCLVHFENTSQLNYYDYETKNLINIYTMLENSKAYSLNADSADNWFVVDNQNDCLLSFEVNQNRNLMKHTWPSVMKPYAMTFLSDRTLCITCHKSQKNGPSGLAVLVEESSHTD